ncbi:tyrosine-type recombinase/integrase [Sedimenticola selenatireducens]|uniref:tyrosine-type recombinase/integrase n=1 Tax=Sedimenticola selenatireducens TaxID=191960 RepID=UPI003747E9AE
MLREPKRRIRFLTREQANGLLQAAPEHLAPVIRYALSTGCRMGEILNLEWRRVDFERQVAWLEPGTTKNGEGRGIPLNQEALLALRSVRGQHFLDRSVTYLSGIKCDLCARYTPSGVPISRANSC